MGFNHLIFYRFGWFISDPSDQEDLIFDHWRSFQNERVTRHFALSEAELERIRAEFTMNENG